jgi:hypothetical protein
MCIVIIINNKWFVLLYKPYIISPATVHYELALAASGKGANSAQLSILSHYSSYQPDGSDVVEHNTPGCFAFCSFDAARRAERAGTADQLPPLPVSGSVTVAGVESMAEAPIA